MLHLEQLLLRLLEHQVEFVLVGGFAAVAHGVTLVTRDVDVCIKLSPENLFRLRDAVQDLKPVHRMTPQKLSLEITERNAADFRNIYLDTTLGQLDCLGEVLGIGDYQAVLNYITEADLGFGKCKILSIEGLIKAKKAMDRPHDRITILQLRAIQQRLAEGN